jgi:hypothetical protein
LDNTRLEQLAEAFADGGSVDAYRRATDKLEARRREIETQLADALPTTPPFVPVGLFSAADLPANIASGGNEGIAVGLAGDDDFRARWETRDLTRPSWPRSRLVRLADLSATVRVASGRGFDPSRLKIHWR